MKPLTAFFAAFVLVASAPVFTQGVILEQGKPEQIFSAPQEPRTQQFLARIVAAGRL